MKKKVIMPLTDEENESYEKQIVCYICKKEFNTGENDKMNLILMKMIKINLILMKTIKMNLILMKMIKMNLNHTIKSEIIVITLEKLEELLIIFVN